MKKLEAIAAAKQFRKDADELLQRMKDHKKALCTYPPTTQGFHTAEEAKDLPEPIDDTSEVIAQHILSIRDLESCIMRQGMALKYTGNPNPYPASYDPSSAVVEPTADGLKL